MITIDAFRKLALSFPEATEEPHFEKTSFRIRKKIFATVAVEKKHTVIMLPVIEQSVFCEIDKAVIYPVAGTWGKDGATVFELSGVKKDIVKEALTAAYCKIAPKALAKGLDIVLDDTETKPTFFATQDDFRKWLSENYDKKQELLMGFYKVGCGKPSITWPQSVDQALCFGWIDGIRRTIDEDSYSIRFTPRRPKSIWSAVNIKKVQELTEKGLMQPAGLDAYKKREDSKSKVYSFENESAVFSKEFEDRLKANAGAWNYFHKMPISYRKVVTHWVMNAKQEATRQKRMNELIADSAAGRKIKSQNY